MSGCSVEVAATAEGRLAVEGNLVVEDKLAVGGIVAARMMLVGMMVG